MLAVLCFVPHGNLFLDAADSVGCISLLSQGLALSELRCESVVSPRGNFGTPVSVRSGLDGVRHSGVSKQARLSHYAADVGCNSLLSQGPTVAPFVLCAFVVLAIHSSPCGSLRIPFRTMVRPRGLCLALLGPLRWWRLCLASLLCVRPPKHKDLAGCNPLLRQGPDKSVSCGCRLSCTSASWPVGLSPFPFARRGSSVSGFLPTFWTSVSPSVRLGASFAVVGCNSLLGRGPTTLPSVPVPFRMAFRLFLFHCRCLLSALSFWCLLPPCSGPSSSQPAFSSGADPDQGCNSLLPQGPSSASSRRLRVPTYFVALARRVGSRRVPAVVRPTFFLAGLGACPRPSRRPSVRRCSCCALWSSQRTASSPDALLGGAGGSAATRRRRNERNTLLTLQSTVKALAKQVAVLQQLLGVSFADVARGVVNASAPSTVASAKLPSLAPQGWKERVVTVSTLRAGLKFSAVVAAYTAEQLADGKALVTATPPAFPLTCVDFVSPGGDKTVLVQSNRGAPFAKTAHLLQFGVGPHPAPLVSTVKPEQDDKKVSADAPTCVLRLTRAKEFAAVDLYKTAVDRPQALPALLLPGPVGASVIQTFAVASYSGEITCLKT